MHGINMCYLPSDCSLWCKMHRVDTSFYALPTAIGCYRRLVIWMETLTANQQKHHVMGGCGEDTTVDSNLRSPRYPTCSGHYHQVKVHLGLCRYKRNRCMQTKNRIVNAKVISFLPPTLSSRPAAVMSLLYLCCTAVHSELLRAGFSDRRQCGYSVHLWKT